MRLIGKLYFERHDNADLVLKKYRMLTDEVRTRLDIDLADSIHTLSVATQVPRESIAALLAEVADIHEQQLKVSDADMMRLVGQMDAILKNLD